MVNDGKFSVGKVYKAKRAELRLIGELDLSAAPVFREALAPYMESSDELILNFSELKYIDSTGMGILISLLKSRDRLRAPLAVTGIPPKIGRLFELTGIARFLSAFEEAAN